MRLPITKRLLLGLAIATLGIVAETRGQNDVFWTAGDANYSVITNWNLGAVPDTQFDARGIISNGGTARVDSGVADTAQIVLGLNATETGNLVIEDNGSLTVRFSDDNSFTPGFEVGVGGSGTLEVQAGGALTTGYLTLGGEGGSTATFSGALGNPATVQVGLDALQPSQAGTSVGAANTLRISSPHVDFETLDFQMDGAGTLAVEITDASAHSPIKSAGAATLNGTLQVEFNGIVPTAGSVWNLFDVASVSGQFTQIDTSAAPPLSFGQSYVFRTVSDPGSINGVLGQLALEQQLVLNVNRDTNEVSIVSGASAVNIDGYRVSSALGGLDATQWNSLENQAVSDWRQSPQNGSATMVAELKPTGSTPVTSGSPIELGALFDLPAPTEFGTELEDIQFEYYLPDGTIVQAEVVYEGDKQHNDFVLVVDPTSGDAVLQNQSSLPISIEGYHIHSDAASLQPGNGDWLSFEDSAASGWRESNVSSMDLIELQSTGTTPVPGGMTFSLGSLFNGGTEDLTFSYLLEGESAFTDGVVVYGAITLPELMGDYNGDLVVDAIDYAVWRESLGDSVAQGTGADGNGDGTINAADYQIWRSNYGMTASPAASFSQEGAVPEPAGTLLLACAIGAASLRRKVA